jgi:hypothetical protein
MLDSEGVIQISDSVGVGILLRKWGLKNLQSVNQKFSMQGFAGEASGECSF